MRFGNYNLTTETVEKRSNLIDFRLKRVKTTANQLVGRFHNKIGTFRRFKQSRSESPLSYKESLFERNISPRPGRKDIFTKDDFPNRLLIENNDYVFGNIKKLGLNQSISGKNKNIYTEFNLKHLLDSKISDENVEYKILKDYFDTTSYSDIVKDTDFKNYLNKKNYNDVLDYMKTDTVNSLNNSSHYKIEFENFDTNKRVYKTWGYGESNNKTVKKTKNLNNNFCNSLKRIKRIFSPDDETVLICPEKENNLSNPKSYCELINSCECLLNNYFVEKKMYKLKNSEINYSEQVYLKIIKHFIKSKGFNSIENYVDTKYTRVFNSVLKSCDEPIQNETPDLAKNFIYEDVFKNYDYITPSYRKTCSTDIPSKPLSSDEDYDNNKEFYFNYNYNWGSNSPVN